MSPHRLVGALLATACLIGCAHQPTKDVERYRANGWSFVTEQDRFTGQVSCRLRSGDHRVVLSDKLVSFRTTDLSLPDAVVRIDAGPPLRWTSFRMALARKGYGFPDDLGGSKASRLTLPADALTAAQSVDVRASGGGPIQHFDVRGMGELMSNLPPGCGRWAPGAGEP